MRAWRSWSRSRLARCARTTASFTAARARAGQPTPTYSVGRAEPRPCRSASQARNRVTYGIAAALRFLRWYRQKRRNAIRHAVSRLRGAPTNRARPEECGAGGRAFHDEGSMMRAVSVIPRLSLLAAGLLACPLLQAQSTTADLPADEAVTLDRVVVEASRLRGVNAFDMPASATVISLQEDGSRAGADVSEALEGIPGV